MAANTSPIFILSPNMQWAKLFASGSTDKNHLASGSLGTDVMVAYSASVNGSRIDEVRIVSLGTNNATVVRLSCWSRFFLSKQFTKNRTKILMGKKINRITSNKFRLNIRSQF